MRCPPQYRFSILFSVFFIFLLIILVGKSSFDIKFDLKLKGSKSFESITSADDLESLKAVEAIKAAKATETTDSTEALENSETTEISGNVQADEKSYPILPSKVYSVIGLEDSGTHFVTGLIRDALNQTEFREGPRPYKSAANDALDVQVQHFSLPWGNTCQTDPFVPILGAVLPPQCYRKDNMVKECGEIAHSLWGSPVTVTKADFPGRFNLDIVSQKEFYDSLGVEQYFIIVLREQNISRKARSKSHCTNPERLEMEEKVGTAIIIDAINKYILNEEVEKQVTPENFYFWKSKNAHDRRQLSSSSHAIAHGNNVVLVSYESLMLLKDTYVKVLFEILGITMNEVPTVIDGNAKYLSWLENSND